MMTALSSASSASLIIIRIIRLPALSVVVFCLILTVFCIQDSSTLPHLRHTSSSFLTKNTSVAFLSLASSKVTTPRRQSYLSHLFTSKQRHDTDNDDNDTNDQRTASSDNEPRRQNQQKKKQPITVSSALVVDIPIAVAFDAFANLQRQPSWAPWLTSVEYIISSSNDNNNDKDGNATTTLWKMRYLGVTTSWTAVTTRQERPTVVAWESTSGLPNQGLVEFEALSEQSTRIQLTMTLVPPRFLSRIVGRGDAMARIVGKRMLRTMLRNFRNVVMQNDLQREVVSS